MTTGAQPPLARRRSRARTLAPLGFAAWAVLEIWLLLLVADLAGGFAVLALLLGGAVLGAAVVKRAGRRAFSSLTETLQQQQSGAVPPSRASEGNGLLMLGGLLLILPTLLSDVAGLLLLLPPVRTAVGRYTERAVDRRIRKAGPLGDAFQQARIHRPDGKVVQGEVIRDDTTSRPPHDEPRPPLTR